MLNPFTGALYRALACFALRDIDLSKCESRPTSVQLLKYLQLNQKTDGASRSEHSIAETRLREYNMNRHAHTMP